MNTRPHTLRNGALRSLVFVMALSLWCPVLLAAGTHVRTNQVGYFPTDTKVAVVSTDDNLTGWTFRVVRISDGTIAFGPQSVGADQGAYCAFSHNYRLDFSVLTESGTYTIRLRDDLSESPAFTIGAHAYTGLHEEILKFFRAQRSGSNPFIPATCHASGAAGNLDAKCLDDNQVRDMEGGWYDAGDYIKFLVTTSNAAVLQLFAYNENKAKFADDYLADGTSGSNGIPDILDEAKHGLDWILKMHPSASKLYYQVGDSRDHLGIASWRLPQNDTVDYELGGYRPAYHGIGANIAGRSAAALAMAYTIWKDDLGDQAYADTCLAAAGELYTLAQQNLDAQGGTEGYYNETSFYDDLELAAAELYKATGTQSYLDNAVSYSSQAGSSWGWFDWGGIHALAHYELYPHADAATQADLKTYLQQDLNANLNTAVANPFRVSTIYGWGSASVMTGTVVMCDLYKKLFPGETTYDALHDEVRDYILGKNQWGVSWVIGLGSTYATDAHHQISYLLQKEPTGTCIEGPMSQSEWNSMNITLSEEDEYAGFQSSTAVYHDDVADWATNEPTIFQAALTLCALAEMSYPDQSASQLKSYVSEIDGSSQVYGLYVPATYDPWGEHPVVMNGHGFGGSANASFSNWQKSWADEHGWMLVKLDGRGNTFYDGVGENDMFRVLEELGTDYNVDADRIYFEGASMGATGAFRQGFRHPDLFAAVAGVDGWGHYPYWHRHWYAPESDPYFIADCQAPLLKSSCAYSLAENVRNLPVWILVDSGDTVVWPDNGRDVHQRLSTLGYAHDFTENAGGHGASYSLASLYAYFDGKERESSPTHLTQATYNIRQGEAYWARIDRLRLSAAYSKIDAAVSGTDVQVAAENVLSYTLKLDESPLSGEAAVTVHHGSNLVYAGPPAQVHVYATIDTTDNSITGWSTNDTLPAALHKTSAIEGPFPHAFESSFIVVYGTSGSPEDTNENKSEADTFCGDWNSWMKASISSKKDSEVTQGDIDGSNLILFGTEDTNSIIASISPALPFSVTESTIQINGSSHDGSTHGIFVIYPNPENPSKYVVICHGEIKGATEKKMEALPWYWPDFVVFDAVNMPPMSVQSPARYLAGAFVDAGFFGQYWTAPADDTDGDGLPGTMDDDDDGDTLSDTDETQHGSNPLSADSDGDGVGDGQETNWSDDTDNDGLINAMDIDSDGDGYTDYIESFYGTSAVNQGDSPPVLRVNFQPTGAFPPATYLNDGGSDYTTGRAFGW